MKKSYKVFLPLKYDIVFREVFSNVSVLRRFISDVTGIPLGMIRSVRVVNPLLSRRYRRQKDGAMDVALLLNDNTRIDIEMQLRRQKYWVKRSLFYLAKMYAEDLKFGEDYSRLRKSITISILDFDLLDGARYHNIYTLRDREGREFTDLFEIHIVELHKAVAEADALRDWIELLNAGTEEELNRIRTEKKEVLEAMEMVKRMNLTRTLKWMYEEKLKAKRDRWAEDEYVRDEGIAIGKAEGRAEGRAEGIAIGEAHGKTESILNLLARLGDVPEDLRDRIAQQRDPEILGKWLLSAADAKNVEEFRDKM